MYKKSKIMLTLVIILTLISSSFSFADDSLTTRILKDDKHVRIVESFDGESISTATFNKDNNTLSVETKICKNGEISKDVLTGVSDLKGVNFDKSLANDLVKNVNSKRNLSLSNDNSSNKTTIVTYGVSIGNSSANAKWGNYGYYNIYSYARIKAGNNRSLIQFSSKDFNNPNMVGWYDDFTDAVDSIITTENLLIAAYGFEAIAGLAALIFAPDITITKVGAIVTAIGLASTAVGSAIAWFSDAGTANKYYDRISANLL